MTKRKKLVKQALKNPENFSFGELAYFERWLAEHKIAKVLRKKGLHNSELPYNTLGDDVPH